VQTVALCALTIATYLGARSLFLRARKHPLLHPVFLSAIVIVGVLRALHANAGEYAATKQLLGAPLGPLTVGLAIPLYKQLARLRSFLVPFVVSVAVGSLCTVAAVAVIARAGGLALPLANALTLKSVTAAIAVPLAQSSGADPSLVVTFVVLTGMLGAMFGPALLSWLGVTDRAARGVALGTISHAIGTSAALAESDEAGAMATLAMMAVPLLMALAGTPYCRWLLQLWPGQ